ncbi:MAG TPA: hypothetical protein VKW06_00360 [Candidatus Angelobacter sp.]|nr:hypothetical protein [Candidatus Angelobacter sp.]
MATERGNFKPNPEEIRANAPQDAKDKPRLKINPGCTDCHGMGWRQAKRPDGTPLKGVVRCECSVTEYAGEIYIDAPRQLPAAPKADPVKAELIDKRVNAAAPSKRFPISSSRPLSDSELEQKKAEAVKVAQRFQK